MLVRLGRNGFDRLRVRHKELSAIASLDDEPYGPSRRLLDLAVAAFQAAIDLELTIFTGRSRAEAAWYECWPGEHYRLLAALTKILQPRVAIEIGTFTGMGALSILQELPGDGRVVTFDLVPWGDFRDTNLTIDDFRSDRLTQVIANVAEAEGLAPHRALFESADFIFIDGPKDGVTEPRIIRALDSLSLRAGVIVMFDDIRVLNMVDVWRNLRHPKMDATSFGHWSGTGLVDWQ